MSKGMASIGLDNPKDEHNVGAVLRACYCYTAALLAIRGKRYKKVATDVSNAYKTLPVINIDGDDILSGKPFGAIPVAVDLIDGAESLVDFKHPKNAFYIFGAEDATLGKKITDRCKHTIYVPTKTCMNLAATVNVVLYDRLAKSNKTGEIT